MRKLLKKAKESIRCEASVFDTWKKIKTVGKERVAEMFSHDDDDLVSNLPDKYDKTADIGVLYYVIAKPNDNNTYFVTFIDDKVVKQYTKGKLQECLVLYRRTQQIFQHHHTETGDAAVGTFLSNEIEHSLDQRVKKRMDNSTHWYFGRIVNAKLNGNNFWQHWNMAG